MEFRMPGTASAVPAAAAGPVDAANQGLTDLATQLDKESFMQSVDKNLPDDAKLSSTDVSNLVDLETQDGPGFDGEEEVVDYIEISYKHRTIAHFKVGPFIFKNHILTIGGTTREVLKRAEQFKDLWRGLGKQDQLNIKRIKNIQNEANVDDELTPRAVRGSVDTAQIADRQAGDRLTPQTPKPGANAGFAARTLPFQVGR